MSRFIKNIAMFLVAALFAALFLLWTLGGTGLLRNVSYNVSGSDGLYTKVREADTVQNVDILFLGSSHAYRTFDPRIFAAHGLRILNLGSSNQTPLQSEVLLHNVLHKVNPGLVVIEVHPDIIAHDGVEAAIYQLCNVAPSWSMALMALRTGNWRVMMTALYAMPRNMVSPEFKQRQESVDGYVEGGFVEHEMAYYSPQQHDKAPVTLQPKQVDALRRCTDRLKQQGVPYMLLEVPDTKVLYNSYSNIDQFKSAMSRFGNFYYVPLEALDDSLHFYDESHLNQQGVELYDNYICNKLLTPMVDRL